MARIDPKTKHCRLGEEIGKYNKQQHLLELHDCINGKSFLKSRWCSWQTKIDSHYIWTDIQPYALVWPKRLFKNWNAFFQISKQVLPRATLLQSTPPNPTQPEVFCCWLRSSSRFGSDWSLSLPVGYQSSSSQVVIGYSLGWSRPHVGAGPSATLPVGCGGLNPGWAEKQLPEYTWWHGLCWWFFWILIPD